jgi:Ca2+-binding EF-hand superfamily protein
MSGIRVLVFSLVLGAGFALSARILADEVPATPVDDVQDVLLLIRPRPTLVRLHVRIGDQPLHAAWRDAVARLHRHLDKDGDGVVKREDFGGVPWVSLARVFGNRQTPAGAELTLAGFGKKLFDGIVTVEELAVMVRSVQPPLSLEERPATASEQDATFARLDADGDGVLSHAELERTSESLRKFDQNDDDVVSRAELMPFQNPAIPVAALRTRNEPASNVVLVRPNESRLQLAQEVVDRLDKGGPRGTGVEDQRLSQSESRLERGTFAALDVNDDESIDSDELMRFLDRLEPDIELIVRLGPPVLNHYAVELVGPAVEGQTGSPGAHVLRTGDKLLTIALENLEIDVQTEPIQEDFRVARVLAQAALRGLDRDDNKSLSLAEVQAQEPFRSLFGLIDRNADGEIAWEEIELGLRLLEELSHGQVKLGVNDRGMMLFGNIDTDNDDRLSIRELRTAGWRLESCDHNGDGRLSDNEIPHRFAWVFSQRLLPVGLVAPRTNTVVTTSRANRSGTTWFEKMDRNRDGDLSPREFLGPRSAFDRLDADGDGLIDAREAKQSFTPGVGAKPVDGTSP